MKSKLLFFVTILLLSSCDNKKEASFQTSNNESFGYQFILLDSTQTNINFANNVIDQEEFNINTYRNFYNGGGVAIGDINNDGLNDIYFTANMSKNKLYLNKGNFKFEDITDKANVGGTKLWSTGVTMVDANSDGLLDIYVCNSGDVPEDKRQNELFINNGDLTFSERAKEFGLDDNGLSTHASFFDYDLDGDLDCFILNNSYKDPERISFYSKERYKYGSAGGDRLYINENNKFIDITKQSGIYSSDIDFGLGVSIGDLNNDLYPDLYISNDFWERDYLYINQKNGTFKDELIDNLSYVSVASMGSDIGDINNDGNLDIFSTDMLPSNNYRLKASLKFDEYYLTDLKWKNSYYYQYVQNCLHVNDGNAKFIETAYFSNVAATDWSWGALMWDMNFDGLKDIFVSNGVYHDITDNDFIDFIADENEIKKIISEKGKYDFRDFVKYLPHNKQKNFAFINIGNLQFENQAQKLKLDLESYSNGAAYGDLDNDGDYDLVVNNVNMPAFIYRSNAVETKENNFIKFKLKGTEKNKFGIGTTIKVFSKDNIQTSQSFRSRGFQSSVDSDLIFGVGKNQIIDSIIVIWSDRKYEVLKNLKTNTIHTLYYKNSKNIYKFNKVENTVFKENSKQLFKSNVPSHKENIYNDYDSERLLPHMLSTEGPKFIKGDVNGDNFEDIILLGAIGQTDKLYLNNRGSFLYSKQKHFTTNINTESTCGALYDNDNDGDLDLLVGMGGNEYRNGFNSFQSKYFENDGKGNFTQELNGPSFIGQVSCIRPFDFDKDGDMDLFIGGRSVPGLYGAIPRSFIFKNDNQSWVDITDEITGPLGMVTDAVWSDYNNDKVMDLIIVGEWMPVTIISFVKNKFVKTAELENSSGWWGSIIIADIDLDGDSDFICGNWGLNSKFQASIEKPLTMYFNDFDGNKKPETLIEWYFQQDEKSYPFASKADLTGQLPFLKKKVLKYKDYATSQLKDMITEEKLKASLTKKVTTLATTFFINENGKFKQKLVANELQLGPVYAIVFDDLDEDKIEDIFLGGNMYRLKPEVGKVDGLKGGYLKGMGKGEYKFISSIESGIIIDGEVRDANIVNGNLLIARNNENVLSFQKK